MRCNPPHLIVVGVWITLTLFSPGGWAGQRLPLDARWRFHLGDVEGGEAIELDDSTWRPVDLPHDWSIEGQPLRDAASGGGGGFFPTGIGWYRKSFTVDDAWRGERLAIQFDGVYENAQVWINGQRLGEHPYGYTPFEFDLTSHVQFGGENVIAVRVDNSQQPNCRWYSGSGIYRHVWLRRYPVLHVPPDGLFLWTEKASNDVATVWAEIAVRNLSNQAVDANLLLTLFSPDGRSNVDVQRVSIDAKGEAATSYELAVTAPQLWSPDAPSLYRAEVRLQVDGQTVDTLETTIGIRQVEISAERGLLINGQPYELVGGNVHHDNGPLGAAAHDRAEERRVEILKAAGFNAIRTSHNPPSTAFLDACDRLGMLVIDEAFDGWAQRKVAHDYSRVFDDWWQRDIAAMVRRDRNHPSVIMWSIGNEVYERGSEAGAQRAAGLAAHVRTLDPTRPVTIGLNGLGKPEDWPRLDRVFTSLDVAGYNYELARHTEDHARLPERVVYSSESYLRDVFADWQASVGHSHVIGAFVWTALDYLGEAGIGRVFPPDEPAQVHWEGNHFPWHGAACGDIDHTGWRKPVSHYRNIVWDRGKSLYAAVRAPAPGGGPWNLTPWAVEPALPSWTWPGQEGRELTVDVYSRHEAVRLYRNDTLIGEQPTTDDEEFHAVFQVPYQLGALRAVGINGGAEVETFALETAGEPAAIRMSVDRSTIRADGSDLAFVEVAIVDEQGRRRFDAEPSIRYELTGPGRIIAVGSSDLTSTQSYQANPRKAYQGRALVVIRSTTDSGQIKLTATANGISDGNMKIRSALQ